MAKRARIGALKRSPNWSGRRDSNPRPSPWQGDALPLRHFRVGSPLYRTRSDRRGGRRRARGTRGSSTLDRFDLVRQDETTAVLSKAFGAVAGDYDRLRPGPSPEALDWLVPPGARDALEIGAGTGILTRLLAERLENVTAVEPDDRMRAVLSAQLSRTGAGAGVKVVAGQAEALPSPDA